MKDIQHDILDKITPDLKEQMKHIFFIADLHGDHAKIVKICNRPVPFTENLDISIPEQKRKINELHNDWLIREVYNKYIDKKDEVYLLGDISMAPKNDAEKFIDRLHGNKFLISGNHDKNIIHSSRFSQICSLKDFTFSRGGLNIHIVLSHFPLVSWNRKIHGSFHIFGHVHGRLSNLSSEIEKFMGLSWDASIDNKKKYIGLDKKEYDSYCKPLNLYNLIEIMYWKSQIGTGFSGEYNNENDV